MMATAVVRNSRLVFAVCTSHCACCTHTGAQHALVVYSLACLISSATAATLLSILLLLLLLWLLLLLPSYDGNCHEKGASPSPANTYPVTCQIVRAILP